MFSGNIVYICRKLSQFMRIFVVILYFLTFVGCQGKKEIPFDTFDFAESSTFAENFSMKFTQSDTIFIKYHGLYAHSEFFQNKNESWKNVETKVTYYGLLQKEDRQVLFDSITKIDFKKFNDEYLECHPDGGSGEFVFQKGDFKKTITFCYGIHVPKDLYRLSNLIGEIKRKTKLLPTNKQVDFKADVSPSPPPPRP